MVQPISASPSENPIVHCITTFFLKNQPDDDWRVSEAHDGRISWIEVTKDRSSSPTQGWKLHVSATVHSAVQVLNAILSVLGSFGVSFKACLSLKDLVFLNSGAAGLSQVGKFVTVYPSDDEQAVKLALELIRSTAGLSGPRIHSDRALTERGIVYYRFGAFTGDIRYQDSAGLVISAVVDPNGNLVEDIRREFDPPSWANDPFQGQGIPAPLEPTNGLLLNRFLCLASLHQSAKGQLFLALDVDSDDSKEVVIKRAYRNTFLDDGPIDAVSMLRSEHLILKRLQQNASFPRLYDYFEDDGDAYLVLESLNGSDLRSYVRSLSSVGVFLELDDVIKLGLRVCDTLRTLHQNGIIHRDLKPGNILLTDEGRIKLLDFELAYDQTGASDVFPVLGTRGYYSPEQVAGERPSAADDVFGLGAVLYFLATNCDPSHAPGNWVYSERSIDLLNPRASQALESIIEKCVAPAADRFSSVVEVSEALIDVLDQHPGAGCDPADSLQPADRSILLQLAEGIGLHLCKIAGTTESGTSWLSTHSHTYGIRQRDVNVGASGIALFLADLYANTQRDIFAETVSNTCDWLAVFDYEKEPFLPGLYVGESGVGLLCMLASQILKRPRCLDFSLAIATQVYRNLPTSPDLFNGLAGCGLYFLILSEVSGEKSELEKAREVGRRIVKAAEATDTECSWSIPEGYGSLSGERFLGFAHGAAGIAYFLIELFDATGDEVFRDYACRAGRHIARRGRPALNDGAGMNWPDTGESGIRSLYWCHGAAGICSFYVRLYEVCHDATFLELASKAGLLLGRGGRWLNPTQCHGLAGNIESLLNLHQATNEDQWLRYAMHLASILRTHAIEQDGTVLWPSEEPTIVTPDFMIGYSGVGECLLRLANGPFRPHLISRKYFSRLTLDS